MNPDSVLSADDHRTRVWRRTGQRSDPAFIVERHTAISQGVTVWGAISWCVWDNHESTLAVIGNCSPEHDSMSRSSVSMLQVVLWQSIPWPPSDQQTAITGIKVEPAFIRKIRNPTPPSNELWLHTTGISNGNGSESVEYTLHRAWLGVVLGVTNF
ncbi:uncharacterized protein TNCV_4883801 [Trichonephila clavipes]|nr:uncharacterized protein TNCV_4883801 [Trichonephila clavipes]